MAACKGVTKQPTTKSVTITCQGAPAKAVAATAIPKPIAAPLITWPNFNLSTVAAMVHFSAGSALVASSDVLGSANVGVSCKLSLGGSSTTVMVCSLSSWITLGWINYSANRA